jgi:hypothetical protein
VDLSAIDTASVSVEPLSRARSKKPARGFPIRSVGAEMIRGIKNQSETKRRKEDCKELTKKSRVSSEQSKVQPRPAEMTRGKTEKTTVTGIRVCQKAGCTIGRAWQRWVGRTQRHDLVESLLVVYLCVSPL